MKYKIDKNGFFVIDVLEDGENVVNVPIPSGLYLPRFDGSAWIEGLSSSDISKIKKDIQVNILNNKRNFELSLLPMTESILKTFESAIGKATRRDTVVNWIDVDNNIIELNLVDAQVLADLSSDIIEEIYFRYRQLKDDVLNGTT